MKSLSISAAIIGLLSASLAGAGAPADKLPSPGDKCPVCGMFVSKYPDWGATLLFKDGTRKYFDGCKDLFKFLSDLKQYAPGRSQSDVDSFSVTDYYAVKAVDGRAAYYVLGSDVHGPMGKELVPFANEAEAREFLKDHKGSAVLRYKEITPAVLKTLE